MKSESNIFRNYLKEHSAQKVLDFGVGAGASTKELLKAIGKVGMIWGLDCTKPEQEISQELLRSANFTYITHDDIKLPFGDCSFDAVLISNTLHHINKEELCARISELYRVLEEDGLFLLVEGIRDKMDSASRTQNYLHVTRAFLDRENGIQHYPQYWKKDIENILNTWQFEKLIEYSLIERREDFKEQRNLDNISNFINELKVTYKNAEHGVKALRIFERIQSRIYKTGYSGTPLFVSIRRKKSAPGRMAV